MKFRVRWAVIPLLIALGSCDRSDPVKGMPLESAGRRIVQLRVLTQLLPNRPTHFAVDRLGQTFWVQESENSQDVLFMIGVGGIPRATRLTTSNIHAAFDEESGRGSSGKSTGNIRALAPAERGVFFYFYGIKGNTPRACIGQYLPQSARIRILADTAKLEEITGMGRSLQLARPTLLVSGQTAWLWLRHSDSSAFVTFDARMLSPFGQIDLKIPFKQVISDNRPVELLRGEGELSPGPAGSLLLLDFASALLWQIDPKGSATAMLSLTGLPRQLSPPIVGPDKRLLSFAADSQRIGSELEILSRQDLPKIEYPALLEITDREIDYISRDNIRAHSGFPVYSVRLTRLVPEGLGTYVSFDANSGALMRVKIVEQD